MLYPKGIVDDVRNDSELAGRFGECLILGERIEHASARAPSRSLAFERWLATDGRARSSAARRYLYFLTVMFSIVRSARAQFPTHNPRARGEGDRSYAYIGKYELMHMINYLYLLHSYGVPGDVLECGAFSGLSTSCLSWACHVLGRHLFVADSFEGLPDAGQDPACGFHPGMYACPLDEVRDNVAAFGRIEDTTFIKGWYRESLAGFSHRLCAVWMDVDLRESALDVLDGTFDSLDADGVVFFHEAQPDHFRGEMIETELNTPGGVREFFLRRRIAYRSIHLANHTGMAVATSSAEARIAYDPWRFERLLMLLFRSEWFKALARETIHRISRAPLAGEALGWAARRAGRELELRTVQGAPRLGPR